MRSPNTASLRSCLAVVGAKVVPEPLPAWEGSGGLPEKLECGAHTIHAFLWLEVTAVGCMLKTVFSALVSTLDGMILSVVYCVAALIHSSSAFFLF